MIFSAGFGGRLLGFWCSDAVKYDGIDPNTELDYNVFVHWLDESPEKQVKMITKLLRKKISANSNLLI